MDHCQVIVTSLPKFSGEYIEWIPFRDIYSSGVHNNDSLTKVQKFYYIRVRFLAKHLIKLKIFLLLMKIMIRHGTF